MELSIVIPVYNEEENVEPLIQEINAAVRPLGKPYEIVVVDDGSRDATFTVLARLHQREPCLRVVRLKRNFGQTAAIAAGLTYAGGDVVVLMDGDAQNDPKDIPALLGGIEKRQRSRVWLALQPARSVLASTPAFADRQSPHLLDDTG